MATYKPNSKGFLECANGPEVRAALLAAAEKAKGIAVGMSEEFRSSNDEPGHQHYADSFDVKPTVTEWVGQFPGPRAAAQLVNTAPHAAAVEWGNEHTPHAHRVLGRTLDALGDA